MAMPGTFTFQLPGKLDKESKAKKGITKLMLLHMCVEINFKELTVCNMTFVTLSNGMEVVLSHPQASRPTSLADLICQTLLMPKEQDHLSIRLKYLSIQMVGKTLAAHMLSGNFASNRVTTLNNEANSINPSAFLPQRNTCMVVQMRICWYQNVQISITGNGHASTRIGISARTGSCPYWYWDLYLEMRHHPHFYFLATILRIYLLEPCPRHTCPGLFYLVVLVR